MEKLTLYQRAARAGIAIMNYLLDHPWAEDTAAGIAQWWVAEEKEVVEQALIFLVREGVVEQRGNMYRVPQRSPPNVASNISN